MSGSILSDKGGGNLRSEHEQDFRVSQEARFARLGLRKQGSGVDGNPKLWGHVILLCSFIFILFTLYTIIIAKLMPETGYRVLDFFRTDQYYGYLVPLTIIPTIIALYLNWVSIECYVYN